MLDSNIFLEDIQPLNEAMGLIHQVKNVQHKAPLMVGEFRFHTFVGGLSMHASNAIELQDSDSALELPAGLSFNLIYNGQIDFSFGGKAYRMRNDLEHTPATCTAIVNDHDEILTRHMTKDSQIEKLNIFVEKKWLTARCQNEQERRELASLFEQAGVYQWQPSSTLISFAYSLLEIKDRNELSCELELELTTMKALTVLLKELKQTLETKTKIKDDSSSPQNNDSLKTALDSVLPRCQSISDVAAALNMSTRTLQRKFKERYQLHASNYIKQRRMDIAKKALLIDDLSIGEASFKAGYNHPSNFVSAFKKLYGLTPTEYKRAHQFD